MKITLQNFYRSPGRGLEVTGRGGFDELREASPLSANEEVTLRRIALGITKDGRSFRMDIKRLRRGPADRGALVATLRLARPGARRYLALPKGAAVDQADSPDDPVAKLAAYMTKARG